jgi:hypothetical protein
MYKFLIIIIALMFAGAGGYYVNSAGGGIISDIVAGNVTTQETLIPVNTDEIPGIYVCNTVSTCKNKYTLLLKSDKTVELTQNTEKVENETKDESTETDTVEKLTGTNVEKGNWDIGVQNMLVITLTEQGEEIYEVPQKIIVKNVRNTTLSKISYTKNNYKDMTNPIFIRQE